MYLKLVTPWKNFCMNNFSIKLFYQKLRGDYQKVMQRETVCNNNGLPRWIFIFWLTMNGKLYTRGRLIKWVSSSSMLALCVGKRMKVLLTYYSNVYLSAQVWKKLLVW